MDGYWWKLSGFRAGFCLNTLRKVAFAGLTCTFALCGALIGSITGAVKRQTTETGLFRGAGIGAVAGAVVSVEVLESRLQGELTSKVGIFGSLVNGKIFREWVSPAILKAYEWQINAIEANNGEVADLFDISRTIGLLSDIIERPPEFEIKSGDRINSCWELISCAICLQDFKDGESARSLPVCRHFFHSLCIDRWLARHCSCPICREVV